MDGAVARAESAVLGVRVPLRVQVINTLLDLPEGDTGHEARDDNYAGKNKLVVEEYPYEYVHVAQSPPQSNNPLLHSRPSASTGRFLTLRLPPPTVMPGVAPGCCCW